MWFQRTGQVYHTGLQRPASLCRSFGAAVVHQKLQSDVIWSSVLVQFQKTLLDIFGKLISFIMSCKMMDTDKSIDDISLDSGFFLPPCTSILPSSMSFSIAFPLKFQDLSAPLYTASPVCEHLNWGYKELLHKNHASSILLQTEPHARPSEMYVIGDCSHSTFKAGKEK